MNKFSSVTPSKQILKRFRNARKQVQNFRSLAIKYGQWRTIRDWNSVDGNRHPTPWYTYPATEYLSHLDLKRFKVLEFGSGNSTLWWASRVKHVTSVEHDPIWHKKVKRQLDCLCNNVNYQIKTEKSNYISTPVESYEIYIVDGKYRKECAKNVCEIATRSGIMIIFDNSDWWPNAMKLIREKLKWTQVDFHGFGPINNYTWTTSIFINPKRHEELNYDRALQSKCGLVQTADEDEA